MSPTKRLSIALALAALVPLPAAAQELPFGWIAKSEAPCGALQQYAGKGETTLVIVRQADGGGGIQLTNANWSAVDDRVYDDIWVAIDRTPFDGKVIGVTDASGNHGFMIIVPQAFFPAFARGTGLHVFRGDQLIDALSLKGSGGAMAAIERCRASEKRDADAAERERKRYERLPDDPFAADAPPPSPPPSAAGWSSGATKLTPRGSPQAWITNDDYPANALRAEQQGTVKFRLDVDATGRVTECTITESSGSDSLDSTACSLLKRRARFTPARDAKGNGVPSSFSSRFRWELPRD